MDAFILQQEVIVLRARVGRLVALLRLLVVLLKVSGFSLARARLPNGATKNSLLRAIERLRSSLPLGTVLRVLVTIFRTRKSRMSCGSKGRAGSALRTPVLRWGIGARNPCGTHLLGRGGFYRGQFELGLKQVRSRFVMPSIAAIDRVTNHGWRRVNFSSGHVMAPRPRRYRNQPGGQAVVSGHPQPRPPLAPEQNDTSPTCHNFRFTRYAYRAQLLRRNLNVMAPTQPNR